MKLSLNRAAPRKITGRISGATGNFFLSSHGAIQVIESILTRLGDLEKAYIIDDYAEGKDTGIIDLLLVGNIDQYHLNDLSRKTERYIKRKIRPLVLTSEEFTAFMPKLENRPNFLVWERQ